MKAQLIKGALAALIAAAAAYFRTLLGPLAALALAMASDYVTGVLAAYRAGTLSSRTGLLGIFKKLGYLFCVGVAVTVDFTVRSAGARLGYDLGGFCAFGLLVTVWLVLNECLSVLENLTELGVPVPGFLRTVVERLKGKTEETGATVGRDDPGAPLAPAASPVGNAVLSVPPSPHPATDQRNAGDGVPYPTDADAPPADKEAP